MVCNTSYKTLVGSKPWRIRFDNIDGFIRVYYETRYLVLFAAEKYYSIDNKIRNLIGVKSGLTYVFSHNYVKIKVGLYDPLPLEKTVTFS